MTFEEFCGEPFWDTNLTWYSDVPDLTSCFQQTALVWIPAGLLWVALPFYLSYLLRPGPSKPTPRCPINIAKMVISGLLILISLCDVIIAGALRHSQPALIPSVFFVTPVVKILTFGFTIIIMEMERRKGFITSGVLFIFWSINLVAALASFYSHCRRLSMGEDQVHFAATFYIYFFILFAQWILSCFSEASDDGRGKSAYPEYKSSFLSRITYGWLTSLILNGYRKPLEEKDVFQLDDRDKSLTTGPELGRAWALEVHRSKWFDKEEKATRLERQFSRSSTVRHSNRLNNITEENGEETKENNVIKIKKEAPKENTKKRSPSLFRAMVSVYGWTLFLSHLCKFVCDILAFVGPLLQRELIAYTTDKSIHVWKGYVYALLLFFTAFINAFFFQQLYHIGLKLGMRIRSAVIAEVYKKALSLSPEARRETTVGEIVNLMSVDAQRLQEVTGYLWMIWSSPLQIAIAVSFLWQLLGVSVLAGLGLMFLLLPANVFLATRQRKIQQQQMTHKDGRIKLMNDVLNGIKILKLYAWELSFQEKIQAIRKLELNTLLKYAYIGAASSFTWTIAPFAVMLSTITAYVLSGNTLDAQTAFVALSLFNVLHFPINLLPVMISNIITANVSIKRIGKFLSQDDLDPEMVTHSDKKEHPITLKDATFSWGSAEDDEPVLSDISFQVEKGSLVAIVGSVGSGKSSLISGLLGELHKLHGVVNVKGSVAYAAQEAWIQNATVRDNILFGKEYKPSKYQRVLEACALKEDLKILPGGDMTEIGEKGINLSGGQRQRVSLARAVYNDADIYLFDDPLSAVDSHVGKHIFDNIMGKEGLLKNKTRVMVTHGLHWLCHVDHVLVLADGGISESGSYEELLSHHGPFAQLVQTYLTEDDEESEDETDIAEVKKDMLKRVDSVTDGAASTEKAEIQRKLSTISMMGRNSSTRATKYKSRSSNKSSRRKTDAAFEMQRFKRSLRETMKQKVVEDKEREEKNKLIETETREVGSVKLSVFSTYGRSVGVANTVILLISFLLYQSCSVIANIWLSMWTSDPAFTNSSSSPSSVNSSSSAIPQDAPDPKATLRYYLGVYGGLGVAQAVFILIYAILFAVGMVRASKFLHKGMLTNILRSPMSFFDTTPSGRILNRFSGDVDVVDTTIPNLLRNWMNTFFKVISSVFVIAYSTKEFLAVIPVLGLIYFFIQRFYIPTSRQLKRLEATSRSPIFSHFGESITGASTIRAYRQEERFIDSSYGMVDHNAVYHLANITSNRWLGFRLDLLSACMVLGAGLFAVIGRDHLSAGVVGLSISYALQATTELNWMVRVTSDLEANLVSVERIKEYSETPTEAEWSVEETKPDDSWPQAGKIEFEDYATRYRPGLDLVLKGISAQVKGGEKIGIVGRTGAGKSSLTLALFRIIEATEGDIVIDDVKIAGLGLHQLRSKITILPQEPVMFAGSLRANLDPLDKFPDDALWRVLEKAHLMDFVNGLSEELEYDCGEGGSNLSVGQRQLVCLARALLRKTRVLVMDEATAAMDLATDELIQETIRTEFADCTTLTIAHRLNTITDSDRIMVLDAGKVAEFDTAEELFKNKDGILTSMAKEAGLSANDFSKTVTSRL